MRDRKNLVELRRAVLEDEPRLIQIQCRAIAILAVDDYDSRQIKALIRSKSKPRFASEITFVAEIDSYIVGFAAMLGTQNVISAVFVDPDFVRQGIASLLLKQLEELAQEQNVPLIWVSSSLTGQSFYRANGYSNVEQINLILGSCYIPCWRMKKRLLPFTLQEAGSELIQLATAFLLASFTAILLQALAQLIETISKIYFGS